VVWALWAALLCPRPLPAQGPARPALLENSAYGQALVTRIREAKRRIICAFFLFKVDDKNGNLPAVICNELVRARQRGVEVTVMLEGGRGVGSENLLAAGRLLKGGVAVVFPHRRRGVTHAKTVVIDDRWVLIGSHNLTQSALLYNNELSVLLDSPELAARVSRYLDGIR